MITHITCVIYIALMLIAVNAECKCTGPVGKYWPSTARQHFYCSCDCTNINSKEFGPVSKVTNVECVTKSNDNHKSFYPSVYPKPTQTTLANGIVLDSDRNGWTNKHDINNYQRVTFPRGSQYKHFSGKISGDGSGISIFDGRMTYSDGSIYYGVLDHNIKQGDGDYKNSDNSYYYSGSYINDQRYGYGTETISYGDTNIKYQGQFDNGRKHDNQAKETVITKTEKTLYIGPFVNGQRHGDGFIQTEITIKGWFFDSEVWSNKVPVKYYYGIKQ